jgi:hypothetical protein
MLQHYKVIKILLYLERAILDYNLLHLVSIVAGPVL